AEIRALRGEVDGRERLQRGLGRRRRGHRGILAARRRGRTRRPVEVPREEEREEDRDPVREPRREADPLVPVRGTEPAVAVPEEGGQERRRAGEDETGAPR